MSVLVILIMRSCRDCLRNSRQLFVTALEAGECRPRAPPDWICGESSLWLIDSFICLCPHRVEERELSAVYFLRAPIPFTGAPSSRAHYLLRPPDTTALGLRLRRMNLEEIQTFRPKHNIMFIITQVLTQICAVHNLRCAWITKDY